MGGPWLSGSMFPWPSTRGGAPGACQRARRCGHEHDAGHGGLVTRSGDYGRGKQRRGSRCSPAGSPARMELGSVVIGSVEQAVDGEARLAAELQARGSMARCTDTTTSSSGWATGVTLYDGARESDGESSEARECV
jgi:hypothetical protein